MTPLSPEIQAELAKLHDIHLPDPIGWWPLALGWWLLLGLLSLGALAALAFEYRRRRTVRYAALRELAGMKARLADGPMVQDVTTDLAVLLRRIVLCGPEAQKFAAISGPDWVARLGKGPGGLSAPIATLIANAPYAPTHSGAAVQDLQKAMAEAEIWIRRHA